MKKIQILILLLLLSLASCIRLSTTTRDFKVYTGTGTEGIVMKFKPNTPPSRIYSSDTLNFLLEVRNKGVYAAGTNPNEEEGVTYKKFLKIYISGFDENIFTGKKEDSSTDSVFSKRFFIVPNLDGKSEFNPEGGISYKDFSTKIENLPSEMDSFKTNFIVTACYNYETRAMVYVCIDPKPYSTAIKEKACTIKDISLSGGQGAPVAITRIEEEASAGKVRFKIYFENKGNGKIFDITTSERSADGVLKCNPSSRTGLKYEDIDKITLNKVSVAGESIIDSCKPSINKVVRLTDGRGFVICEKEIKYIKSAFTTSLEIDISYGYTSSIQKEIEILKALE